MPRRKLHDEFFKKAKAEGYLARSAYKLIEIDDRFDLLRPGDRVLDLGCAPGSWLQIASERVGERGRVVGIDLKPVEHPMPDNVLTQVVDIASLDPVWARETVGGRFDVVLSDMAPNTSGAAGNADHHRSVGLCERVLDVIPAVLAPGGRLAMKVFEGEALPDLAKRIRSMFAVLKHHKPRATRQMSREIYIVAAGFKGEPKREPAARPPAGPPAPRAGWGQ